MPILLIALWRSFKVTSKYIKQLKDWLTDIQPTASKHARRVKSSKKGIPEIKPQGALFMVYKLWLSEIACEQSMFINYSNILIPSVIMFSKYHATLPFIITSYIFFCIFLNDIVAFVPINFTFNLIFNAICNL